MRLPRFFRELFAGKKATEPRPESIDLKQKRGARLSGKPGGKRFLAYSPEFKKFVREHREILVPTLGFFRENLAKLEAMPQGQEIVDEKTGVRIKKELTGSYKGMRKDSTFKVVVGEKEFFVKIRQGISATEIMGRTQKLDSFLREKGYKINGFNVKVIKPHLMYKEPNGTSLLVTEFYNEKRVKMVYDLKGRLRKKIDTVLENITGHSEGDFVPVNSFYEIKTNTIWLFDI